MAKGKLVVTKSSKGKIIVALDKLNGKPPMALSYVSLADDKHNGKDCVYEIDSTGRILQISIDGVNIHSLIVATNPKQTVPTKTASFTQPNKPWESWADSFDASQSKLPKQIRELLVNQNIDNFALKYKNAGQCIPDNKGKNKFYFFKNDRRTYRDNRPPTGHQFFIKHNNYGNINFEGIIERQTNQLESGFSNYQKINIKTDWRLICGLSGGIYETDMTLHHIYGIPYIPSSSLKGVIRSWLIQSIWGNTQESEADAFNQSQLMCDLFGCPEKTEYEKKKDDDKIIRSSKLSFYAQNQTRYNITEKQGDIIFFDAFPTSAPSLEPDIMNVHYPDWYDKGTAPTDTQSPNPIVFLTVGANTIFQTYVATLNNLKLSNWSGDKCNKIIKLANLTKENTILDLITYWLKATLSQHGIGAKTAVGYGYFA